jgi:hypothetical protein
MSTLSNKLVVLNDDLSQVRLLERLDRDGSIGGRRLGEADYDVLIVRNLEALASALQEAGLIDPASTLVHLGKTLSIDILLAEVDRMDWTFRRFVIVEDKLFRNPEARREVLGQVLDYARTLRQLSLEELSDRVPDEQRAWLEANEDLLVAALRTGDFLLLVCGDRIRPRLIDYLDFLKEQLDPLVAVEVALVSVAIFSGGGTHVLVPYVAAALITAERPLTVKVVVKDSTGGDVPAQVAVGEEPGVTTRRERIEEKELLDAIRQLSGDGAVEIALALFHCARESGAEVLPAAASASVRIRNPSTRKFATMFVVTRKATFYVGWLTHWAKVAGISSDVAARYQEQLTKILGRSPLAVGTGGTNAVPLEMVGKHIEAVSREIALAASALLGKRPRPAE